MRELKALSASTIWRASLNEYARGIPDDILPSGRILVTGATGLVGSALVDLLLAARSLRRIPMTVVATSRSYAHLSARFGNQNGLEFLEYDATRPFPSGQSFTAVIHAASNSSPKLYIRLVLKSAGSQVRSYCHCLDCATALLFILSRGTSATAYNVANPDSVLSIREMTSLLAEAGGVPVAFGEPSTSERVAFNPMADSSLDPSRLLALGWRGRINAHDGLFQTVKVLRELL